MIGIIDEVIDETMNLYQCSSCGAQFPCWIKLEGRMATQHKLAEGYVLPTAFVEPKYCPYCGDKA